MSNQNIGTVQLVSSVKCFGGSVKQFKHSSSSLKCEMTFHIFVPEGKGPFPALFFLSGLTCNDTNFITKACAIQFASKHQIALVCPDTSPRGEGVPTGASGEWDFGHGAGFYLNATKEPFNKHYHMYDYVVKEIPEILVKNQEEMKVNVERLGICGHSMGGHGALTIFLKNPKLFKSCSAFAPICHPSSPDCAWGQKAFNGYLSGGANSEECKQYDAVHLMRQFKSFSSDSNTQRPEILIDQGTADKFYPAKQLQPEAFQEACKQNNQYPLKLRMQQDYDHSYYFIQSFIEDHIQHHASYLSK